jgi:hypothetical protein
VGRAGDTLIADIPPFNDADRAQSLACAQDEAPRPRLGPGDVAVSSPEIPDVAATKTLVPIVAGSIARRVQKLPYCRENLQKFTKNLEPITSTI